MSRIGTTLSDLIQAAQASTLRIDVERLRSWLEADEPLLLVDVREEDEYGTGHLPGALSIPRGFIEPAADRAYSARDPELAEARWRRVVLYCDCPTGARAVLAAEVLQRMGFQHVYYLAGGIGMWQAEGLPDQHESIRPAATDARGACQRQERDEYNRTPILQMYLRRGR